jgi:hypothetical protein
MRVTSYGESRYLKAYLAYRCASGNPDDGRQTKPPAARYKVKPARARQIESYVDGLLNSYYHHRRTRKRRVVPPSDQGGT